MEEGGKEKMSINVQLITTSTPFESKSGLLSMDYPISDYILPALVLNDEVFGPEELAKLYPAYYILPEQYDEELLTAAMAAGYQIRCDEPIASPEKDQMRFPLTYRSVEIPYADLTPPRHWYGRTTPLLMKEGEITFAHDGVDVCYSGPPLLPEEYERQRRTAEAWFNHGNDCDDYHVGLTPINHNGEFNDIGDNLYLPPIGDAPHQKCPSCMGSGGSADSFRRCNTCYGTGRIYNRQT